MSLHSKSSAVSTAGLLISLGIIYGDIGTSPLYVMKAIIGNAPISEALVYGGISPIGLLGKLVSVGTLLAFE